MRESPSGPANAHASAFLDGIVLSGAGGSNTTAFNLPGAKIGDTVAVSFDSGSIGPCVHLVAIPQNGLVLVNVFNFLPGPFTINDVTMFIEVFPRG
jgi:hypothetical protein